MSQREMVVEAPVAGRAQAFVFLAVGIVAMAFSAVFIRYAQADGMPSLFIAGGRLTTAALLLTPFALRGYRAELRGLRRKDLALAMVSGAVLAVHFGTWIASLEYTSVLISVVLVSTSPLWVAAFELVFLRARPHPFVIIGLLVALVGGIFIGLGTGEELFAGKNPLVGGLLALTGALAMAIYLVIGRKLRARLPLIPYIWLVYGCAAITLMSAVMATGTPVTGYTPRAYLMILLLALIPQLVGHTSLNNALRYLSATFVSVITQTEGVASALAAFVLFGEVPKEMQIIGSVAILAGVILAIYGQRE